MEWQKGHSRQQPHTGSRGDSESGATRVERDFPLRTHGRLSAHSEIELAPTNQKSAVFFRHFLPLRHASWFQFSRPATGDISSWLWPSPRQTGRDPHHWVWSSVSARRRRGARMDSRLVHCWRATAKINTSDVWDQSEVLPGQNKFRFSFQALPHPSRHRNLGGSALGSFIFLSLFRRRSVKDSQHVPATDSEEKLECGTHSLVNQREPGGCSCGSLRAAIERCGTRKSLPLAQFQQRR